MPKTDAELAGAAATGDRAAYGELVNRYRDRVVRQCHRMAGNWPDAEDLAHEAFVDAFVKLGQLRDHERFGAWLRVVALNVCRMWLRARHRDWAALEEAARAMSVDASDDERAQPSLRNGINRLSRAHRLMLVLHYFEGLSYEEIAQFLEVPIGTAMSRLHRARNQLKDALTELDESEDDSMPREEGFTEEVDAEIAVLLQMFGEQPNAMERLTVILARSPERFADLVTRAEDDETLHRLGILLPRLGRDAMGVVVRLGLEGDAEARARATALLRAVVASGHAVLSAKKTRWGLPSASVYGMLDALFGSKAEKGDKAELLVNLLDASDDEPTQTLLTCSLLCFQEEAGRVLMDRYWEEESWATPSVLYALCRMPAFFTEALIATSDAACGELKAKALVGLEALARSVDGPWLVDAGRRAYLNELRTREKWPPIRSRDLDPNVITALEDCAARLAASSDVDSCVSALRILGELRANRFRAVVVQALEHADEQVRVAALLALAELGDQDDLERFTQAIELGTPAERRAAAGLLSRFDVEAVEPLLAELTKDSDRKVQQAAVLALGEVSTDSAAATLRELLKSGDKRLAKLAASALYGGVPGRVKGQTIQEKILRGDLEEGPVTHISLDAAMRFSFDTTEPRSHQDITRQLAAVCGDYSATRRYLIEQGLMARDGGVYEFTDRGLAVWRVEHVILDTYLNKVCSD